MKYRKEKDTMGIVDVPKTRYWGTKTKRNINNYINIK